VSGLPVLLIEDDSAGRQLRQKGLHMSVIILSAQQGALDEVPGLEIGIDAYLFLT
jgi:DNA-binding response OmpR family regulator